MDSFKRSLWLLFLAGTLIVGTSMVLAQSAPKILSISPGSGRVGMAVAIVGSGFGTTVGSSTVTFNGIAASPISWSTIAIKVTVPAGATTGDVLVTVNGQPSNAVSFVVRGSSASPTNSSQ